MCPICYQHTIIYGNTTSPILNLNARTSFKRPKNVMSPKHPNGIYVLANNDTNIWRKTTKVISNNPYFFLSLLMPHTSMDKRCNFIEKMWKMKGCYFSLFRSYL